jgi:hypothetical protein
MVLPEGGSSQRDGDESNDESMSDDNQN